MVHNVKILCISSVLGFVIIPQKFIFPFIMQEKIHKIAFFVKKAFTNARIYAMIFDVNAIRRVQEKDTFLPKE